MSASGDPHERPALPGPLFAGPSPLPPSSHRKRSRLRRASYALAAPLASGFLRALWWSLRVRVVEGEQRLAALAPGEPALLCGWHAELVPAALFFGQRLREGGAQLGFLISPSVDGDLATLVAERGGGRVVRGSATRSGVKALRDLYRLMKTERVSPLFLSDGPQGPPQVCKAGAPILAQLAGAPIVPFACAVRPALRLPTWDRLILPLPFARVAIAVGEARRVGAADDVEVARAELETELRALTDRVRGV